MAYYLGIDGGGTKTRCVLGDEKHVLATAVSGGSNIVRLGEAAAREALQACVRQVCESGKIALYDVQAVCIGASGAGRPETAGAIQAMVRKLEPRLEPGRVQVVGDTVIALWAAFGPGPGVVTIAGTGSIAFGRDADGQIARAGGWGFAISDEGSGQWIGKQAVSAILRARDRSEETALTALVVDHWKLADVDALIGFANATPPPEFPRLFSSVLRAAEGGDAVAREILTRAGTELAALAAVVIRRLAPDPPFVPVATAGSVFRQSEQVRTVFYNELHASFAGIEIRDESVDPALGALALARAAGANQRRERGRERAQSR